MRTVDLSDYELDQTVAEELQEFEEGQFVEHEEYGAGLIGALLEESFDFPDADDPEDETIEIEASSDDPVYMVALLDGGSVPAEASDLTAIDELPGDDGEEPDDPEDIDAVADEIELSPVYDMVDDPHDEEQLEEAQKRYVHKEYAEEIAEYVEKSGTSLKEVEEMSVEELRVNVQRIDRAGIIGFRRLPPGWNRKSVLKAWNTLRRKWRTCRARMLRHFGNELAKRWCAVLKDEVYRTTRWRNRW